MPAPVVQFNHRFDIMSKKKGVHYGLNGKPRSSQSDVAAFFIEWLRSVHSRTYICTGKRVRQMCQLSLTLLNSRWNMKILQFIFDFNACLATYTHIKNPIYKVERFAQFSFNHITVFQMNELNFLFFFIRIHIIISSFLHWFSSACQQKLLSTIFWKIAL